MKVSTMHIGIAIVVSLLVCDSILPEFNFLKPKSIEVKEKPIFMLNATEEILQKRIGQSLMLEGFLPDMGYYSKPGACSGELGTDTWTCPEVEVIKDGVIIAFYHATCETTTFDIGQKVNSGLCDLTEIDTE